MKTTPLRLIGMEIEMPSVGTLDGLPPTHEAIESMYDALVKNGAHALIDPTTQARVGVTTEYGSVTPDNSMCTVECSLNPHTTLQSMAEAWNKQIVELKRIAPDLFFLSLARQPVMSDDITTYNEWVAKKGIYPVIRDRDWDHRNGLTTSATQACIDVSVDEAIEAVETLQGLTPWIVGLCANSPLAYGKPTGFMESRLASWDRMMATSHFPADKNLINVLPHAPHSWVEYLEAVWNQSPILLPIEGTGGEYKKALCIVPTNSNMSMLDFLENGGMFRAFNGTSYSEPYHVEPSSFFVDKGFWWVFYGARLRMQLPGIDPREIARAVRTKNEEKVKKLIKQHVKGLYIEVRDPGTTRNPLAIVAFTLGVLENLSKASAFVRTYDWNTLAQRRTQASIEGMSAVTDMQTILNIAREGLVRRGLGEETFLDPLFTQTHSPAVDVLNQFEQGGIASVVQHNHF